MNAVFVVTILLTLTPAVRPNAEKDSHHHELVHEIGEIKERLKALRDLIDGTNEDSCQSGVYTTVVCDVAEKVSSTIKCIMSEDDKHRTKRNTVAFARKFNTNPVVTTALSGMNFFFGADVDVSAENVQKNNFQQVVKSDNMIAPLMVVSDSFVCPSKLHAI